MTDGGSGVAFISPFNNDRYFFPRRPIRVSPIGVSRFFTERGLEVLASELLWIWLPSVLLAALAWLWHAVAPPEPPCLTHGFSLDGAASVVFRHRYSRGFTPAFVPTLWTRGHCTRSAEWYPRITRSEGVTA